MNNFTKILATIGPATCQPETIRKLFDAGINAIRINMSHGDRSSQTEYIQNIRKLNDNFPILIDTKGPEIRTGKILNNAVDVGVGSTLRLIESETQMEPDTIPVDYPHLDEIPVGTRILFDDGLVESEVVKQEGNALFVRVINDGPIGTGKKVTIQGYRVQLPFLTERDKQDIQFAVEKKIRLMAVSFVRSADDIKSLKSYLAALGTTMMLFSKIETGEAVANLEEILEESDGIMVARGDLGVELPLQEVPEIQNRIIKQCNQAGKPVIVATQMLESMRENARPTRAEVNDVAHAILQGADAIMLSAETATGKYPIRSVEMMRLISNQYEKQVSGIIKKYRRKEEVGRTGIAQYIAKAAYHASEELGAKAILTPTESGFTARNVSRFKPKCPILASTRDSIVVQLLHLVWGVFPRLDIDATLDLNHYAMSYQLIEHYYKTGILSEQDRIIIISGSNLMTKRGTNLLEVYSVKDIIEDGLTGKSDA
ncbi:pyruvate kinase [Desulfosarcina widdelii]|uniref:Pyruvate kinase n=1 Tax=Desulfosarcina widdelii TaxID=947919 RepID=A0A5K7Z4Z8_9BACT|nr:pyruvate kinase [Desulfosarcina widdelii]BBO75795.1 pyruvate kinase [Desulfosarcina widdelii]